MARIGAGRFVAAYAVPAQATVATASRVARSSSPLGPYVDSTARPLTCLGRTAPSTRRSSVDRGARLAALQGGGLARPDDGAPADRSGTAFGPTSRNYTLLAPRTAWEGSVVENPAMIRFHGRLYLFYSANGYGSSRYATGYAVCKLVDRAVHADGPAALHRPATWPGRAVRRRSSTWPAGCG